MHPLKIISFSSLQSPVAHEVIADMALARAEGASEQGTLGAGLKKAKVWERVNQVPVNERQRKVINRLLDGFEKGSGQPHY